MAMTDQDFIDRLNELCAKAPSDLEGAELMFAVNVGDDFMYMRLGCAHLQRDLCFSKGLVRESPMRLDLITFYYDDLVNDLRKALQFSAETPAND